MNYQISFNDYLRKQNNDRQKKFLLDKLKRTNLAIKDYEIILRKSRRSPHSSRNEEDAAKMLSGLRLQSQREARELHDKYPPKNHDKNKCKSCNPKKIS